MQPPGSGEDAVAPGHPVHGRVVPQGEGDEVIEERNAARLGDQDDEHRDDDDGDARCHEEDRHRGPRRSSGAAARDEVMHDDDHQHPGCDDRSSLLLDRDEKTGHDADEQRRLRARQTGAPAQHADEHEGQQGAEPVRARVGPHRLAAYEERERRGRGQSSTDTQRPTRHVDHRHAETLEHRHADARRRHATAEHAKDRRHGVPRGGGDELEEIAIEDGALADSLRLMQEEPFVAGPQKTGPGGEIDDGPDEETEGDQPRAEFGRPGTPETTLRRFRSEPHRPTAQRGTRGVMRLERRAARRRVAGDSLAGGTDARPPAVRGRSVASRAPTWRTPPFESSCRRTAQRLATGDRVRSSARAGDRWRRLPRRRARPSRVPAPAPAPRRGHGCHAGCHSARGTRSDSCDRHASRRGSSDRSSAVR